VTGAAASSREEFRIYVVDRHEGKVSVLVADDVAGEITVESKQLPSGSAAEGAVLRVPLDAAGQPQWSHASRDKAQEARRRADLAERMNALRRADAGGDVAL
jgi:Protein of unknown function (DUF3006)